MSYKVYLTKTFQKYIKVLKKKYRHIKDDLAVTIQTLEKNPGVGDSIPGWSKEIWKIRVASSDIKKGKRGSFRVVYKWRVGECKLYLLVIYFKGEKEAISKKQIEKLLKKLNQDISTL